MTNLPALATPIFAAVLLLSGCSREPETPAALAEPLPIVESSTPVQDQAAQPATSIPNPTAPGRLAGTVHPFMTAQLRIFVRDKGRMPKDFREFATARMDSVPFAPEGMRYVIDAATTEVKLVKE